jgi:ABC-type multidrug transport system ATPase subunit
MFQNNTYDTKEVLMKAENLSVQYGDKLIIRDIGNATIPFQIDDIVRSNIQQGQVVAILGRSGRGKSTLFKAIGGIVEPAKGQVTLYDSKNGGSYRKIKEGDVGFVQQNFPLSRNQTVSTMLMEAAKQGQYKSNAKEVVDQYLQDWGLAEQRLLAPNQLSGGQKQRVAIIEQLLCSHHYMIFDEPFSGLDVVNIEGVKESFRKITSSNEINTIIFSTHDIEIAVEMADQIYVIGYERDTNNQLIQGGTVVGYYDLKKMNLAWKEFSDGHLELANMIKKQMAFS